MTDEKLEKKAEEYCNNEVPLDTTESGEKLYTEYDLKQTYIVSAKVNNIVWHKQSDTDDIYDACNDWESHYFVCKMKDGSYNIAFGNCDEDGNGMVSPNIYFKYEDSKYCLDDIIAWCEIPKFKE